MKAVPRLRSPLPNARLLTFLIVLLLPTSAAFANQQLILSRAQSPENTDYKGLVDLAVDPGFDAAKVSITVDGEHVLALHAPYRVTVDLGQRVIQHKITVTAWTKEKKRAQWNETINQGHMPLTVKLQATNAAKGEFDVDTTAPDDDPISVVELWDNGNMVAKLDQAPYHLTVPAATLATGFVQVTARTKSGEEAADFWSAAGDVKVDNVDVRTVPLFVSVVDRNGTTRDDVDRALFKIIDGGTEGKILQFSRAFDQPISIALLIDSSSSMAYSMNDVSKAAHAFVDQTLKKGDRCVVYAVRDVPRVMQPLTDDKAAIGKALNQMVANGETALYDAVDTAIRDLKDEKNRRAIVILTDGGDNDSLDSWDDVERSAREAGIPIYFLAYESLEATAARDFDRMTFLASETGGFVARATPETLMAKYTDIEKDLRAQFSITYQVTSYAKHNEWRTVRVLLSSPKLTARTIGGYFAP
jgi:Ca-activated chloride channel family protein